MNENLTKAADVAKDVATEGWIKYPIDEALLISLIGFATVFIVLIVLMFLIQALAKLVGEKQTKKAEPAPVAAAPVSDEVVDAYTGVKLVGVSDKDAALIMAIVADELDKPLDNLRFISIKEVK
ncbi:MAG: OadG family protein [Clostridia bacterium]|nr:OadG family protein [Clostridia bacterium]